MHGITHLYRQHAIEKQLSSDCWQNGGPGTTTHPHPQHQHSTPAYGGGGRSYVRENVSITSEYGSLKGGSSRLSSIDSSSSSSSSSNSKSPNWSQGKISFWIRRRVFKGKRERVRNNCLRNKRESEKCSQVIKKLTKLLKVKLYKF